eukprot:scaffold1475_cov111-Cylindrotheca_fusiformis.AAC.3
MQSAMNPRRHHRWLVMQARLLSSRPYPTRTIVVREFSALSSYSSSLMMMMSKPFNGIPSNSLLLHHQCQERYEYNRFESQAKMYFASASNSFWRELNQAVQQGDGMKAEEMVQSLLSLFEDSRKTKRKKQMDSRLFSSVLLAWKNNLQLLLESSPSSSSNTTTTANTTTSTRSTTTLHFPHAALRAYQWLEQMDALAKDGILTEGPSLEDCHIVLEAFYLQSHVPASELFTSLHRILSSSSSSSSSLGPEPTTTTYELVMSILGKGGHIKEAVNLLRDIRNFNLGAGIEPTLAMYNSVLQSYYQSASAPVEPALKLLRKMQAQASPGIPHPNGDSYNIVIASCCAQTYNYTRGGDDDDDDGSTLGVHYALELLDEMKTHKVRRTLESYIPVISGLATLGEARKAEDLLTRLIQDYGSQFDAELKPSLQPFQTVLWAYSKSYHPDAAKRAHGVLDNMRELYSAELLRTEPNVVSYNMVLKCWAQSKLSDAPQRAMDLYEEMQRSHVTPDSTSMNTVLNTWASKATPAKTEEVFWKFYERYLQDPLQHPQPNAVSFGTVLKAWASSKSSHEIKAAPDRAEALFRKLFELHQSGWDRCKPDVVIFASLIQCWGKSEQRGAAEKAESLLRKMQQLANEEGETDMVPDTICWNLAIQSWSRAGNGERAEALFKEMLAAYIRDRDDRQKPNIITFTAVLSGWAKTRFYRHAPKRAEQLLEQMEKLHESGALDVKPNCVSYSILLDCLAYSKKQSSAEKAERILQKMKQSDDHDFHPNVISYNSVIKAWSYTKDPRAVDKVFALLEELLEKSETDPKLTPNANTFGSVLKTIADSRLDDKRERAESLLLIMEKYGVSKRGWIQNQLQRCQSNVRSKRSSKLEMPEMPALKYR